MKKVTSQDAKKWIKSKYPDIKGLKVICVKWNGLITYPTGVQGYHGIFELAAPGYRRTRMIFEYDDVTGTMLR